MDISKIQNSLTIDEKIRFFNGVGNWETFTANSKIPQFFMSDGPHGLRKQTAENYKDINKSNVATCFPTASCLASSWNPDLAAELGKAIATEAKAEKVNLLLGPGMNIKRSPLCGRNFEYFSEDPFLTGKMAAAYVNGLQSEGVGSCIKHFACNNQEKRRQTSSSNVDEKTLRKIYLSAFEYVVKNAKPAAIMCSYNKLNGTYTCHNRHLLQEILRDEWNYTGVVVSDWGACIDAAKCISAGMDLAMPDSSGYFDSQLKDALLSGKITEQDLDKANKNLLNLIDKYGSKDNEEVQKVDYSKQHQIALKLAENSAVLLKNHGMLPISPEKSKKILVIGELAKFMKFQGGGSSHITTEAYPNALESLKSAGFDITYEPGYLSSFCPKKKIVKKNLPLLIKAIAATQKAALTNQPILLFVGLTDTYEGEGFDRKDLHLPSEQIHLIHQVLEFSSNVTIVSFSGAPIDLTVAHRAKAILHMYLCGEACGEAVANLITGKVNPSGKLAETWPLKVEDTPCYKNFALDSDKINYEEGELIGYRWYNHKLIPVQYPFGYGLSYTTFQTTYNGKIAEESQIRFSDNLQNITVSVKNTGLFDGAETVQCYKNGELCGFSKVFLKSGEEKEITIDTMGFGEIQHTESLTPNFKSTDETKGSFTITSSLGDMAKESFRVKIFLSVILLAIRIMNKKSFEDPSVKIQTSAIKENPLESLISTSGGIITVKLAKLIVKWANK